MAITLSMDRHLLHRYGAGCDFGACAPAPDDGIVVVEVALLLILPGFISRKVYDLRVPSEAPDTARYVVDALFYGTLNGSIWFLPILWLAPLNETQPLVFLGVLLVALVASPVLLALATVHILSLRRLRRWTRHPIPTAWDHFFGQGKPCWMLFRLKNGTAVGGYFGPGSFASSFPHGRDVYLEQSWLVNETGAFEQVVRGTAGVLVSMDDCVLVEFFESAPGADSREADHG